MTGAVAVGGASRPRVGLAGAGSDPDDLAVTTNASVKARTAAPPIQTSTVAAAPANAEPSRRLTSSGIAQVAGLRDTRTGPIAPAGGLGGL
jgi:hypothetical protein